MSKPKFTETDAKGRLGVHLVGTAVSSMRCIFREQPPPDTGIDAHIEVADGELNATGRLIGCQIKAGPSYFSEELPSGYVYRGDPEHLAYWLGHSLPVIIVLCNTDTGLCYWQSVNQTNTTATAKGWRMEIPKSQVLDNSAKQQLSTLADTGWIENARTFTTPQKFFQRVGSNPLFDYDQTLYGRRDALAELDAFAGNPALRVAIVSGRGGIGKSRFLREWTTHLSNWKVLVKKDSVSVGPNTEQEIGAGKHVIVVDDAHRQQDIDTLLQLASDLSQQGGEIKVVLSCRPVGLDRINSALSRSFPPKAVFRAKELQRLADADVRALAAEVLGPQNSHFVPFLVEISRDTPLVTVVGGRLLRRGAVPIGTLPSAEEFRRTVFDRFLDDFETLSRQNAAVRNLLYLISAMQPIAIRESNVQQLCAEFLRVAPHEVALAVDELEAAALLVRNGADYRIAPDMFADFLLEKAAVGMSGTPTGFADAVYRSFGNAFLGHLLQNIAELDFRITSEGQTSLLGDVWKDIQRRYVAAANHEKAEFLKSIEVVAFYQPAEVMQLVRATMDADLSPREDHPSDRLYRYSADDVLRALPPVLRAIGYQPAFREEAIRILWRLAKRDAREPNSYPEHALRILKSIAAYSRYKTVDMNLDVARIVRSLCSDPDAFSSKTTPLEIIDELLERDVEEQESSGRTLTLTSFGLRYDVIAPVRDLCLQTLTECLESQNAWQSCRAFKSFETLISGFLPKFGRVITEEESKWHGQERQRCLEIVRKRLLAGRIPLQLAQQIRGGLEVIAAFTENDQTKALTDSALGLLPGSIELEAFDWFASATWRMRKRTIDSAEIEQEARQNQLDLRGSATAFFRQFESVADAANEFARFYRLAHECYIQTNGANEFAHELCGNQEFLSEVAKRYRSGTYASELAECAQVVVRRLREFSHPEYLSTGLSAASSTDVVLKRSAAIGLWGILPPIRPEDVAIVDALSKDEDRRVREFVIRALASFAKDSAFEQSAIDRILALSPGEDAKLADEMCDAFLYNNIPLTQLTDDQVGRLLGSLLHVRELDEHGIELVLSWAGNHKPVALARFLGSRLAEAVKRRAAKDWSYKLTPRSFRFSGDHAAQAVSELRASIRSHLKTERTLTGELIDLYWRITLVTEETFSELHPWFRSADQEEFELAIRLLGRAPGDLAFSHASIAREVLHAAEMHGKQGTERAMEMLVAGVHPGVFYSTREHEASAKEELAKRADEALELNPNDPLLSELYSRIKKAAKEKGSSVYGLPSDEDDVWS